MKSANASYDPGHLLVAGSDRLGETIARLRAAAHDFGWDVELRNLDGTRLDLAAATSRTARGRERFDLPTVYRAQIAPAPRRFRGDRAVAHVDARRLLFRARAGTTGRDVSLDHILSIDQAPHATSSPGAGGRRVARWVGPPPRRTAEVAEGGRRPVVAVLDTGCGSHPWLGDDVVTRSPAIDGSRLGLTERETDPDVVGDVTGAFDGAIDAASGHGTFIAGIVRQVCPDADLVTARVTDSDGTVSEGAFFYAVRTLVKGMLLPEADGGLHIDVLNLSLSSYDANPADLLDRALVELLRRARRCGCAVVCSAGNEATSTPTFPAALWTGEAEVEVLRRADLLAPHLAIGARNPDGTYAPFSNHGPWVHAYVPGVDVLSSFPPLNGGRQALVSTTTPARLRESLDPDDFGGGFALWSGTSFAAPYVAGMLAGALVQPLTGGAAVGTAVRIALLQEASQGLTERFGTGI